MLMNKTTFPCLLAALLAFQGATALAQRYRVADPRSIPAVGNGWAVNPTTRALTAVIPVQTLPGYMPVPLTVRLNGTYCHQETTVQLGIQQVEGGVSWTPNQDVTTFPIFANVHFGYIASGGRVGQAMLPLTYVLEDGSVYLGGDFTPGNTLSLLQEFGLASTPTASTPMTSSNLSVATYGANLADLGSLGAQVQALTPVGFDAATSAPATWAVLVTANRARVYAYIDDFKANVPVIWVDKFGHQVTFQWTKQVAGLPTGVTAIYSVKVFSVNPNLAQGQYPGIQVQWAAGTPGTVQDVVRADFINVDAPSLRVQGWVGGGGIPAPVDLSAFDEVDNPGPPLASLSFCPQTITIGPQGQVPAPNWIGAGQPLPTAMPENPNQNSTPQVWTIGYEPNHGAVSEITEPSGLKTLFTNQMGGLSVPFNLPTIATGKLSKFTPGKIDFYGVNSAISTDSVNGFTRTQNWTWDTSSSIVHQDYFGTAPLKETRIVLNTVGQNAANSTINTLVVRDPVTKAMAKQVVYTYTTAGTDGTLTPCSSLSTTYPATSGLPNALVSGIFQNQGLALTEETVITGSSQLKTQEIDFTYNYLQAYLEPARLLSKNVYRNINLPSPLNGLLTNATSQGLQYDGNVAGGPGLITQVTDGLGLGQNLNYYGNGKPKLITEFNSNLAGTINAKTLTYDPATGSLASTTTSFAKPLGSTTTGSLSVSVQAFDSMGRATQVSDENGVVSTYAYDTWGRLQSKGITGVPAATIT